jgi:hypothetical protein
MSTPTTSLGDTVWVLPPLILHPFNEHLPPSALLENSKAALMLSGLIPNDGSDPDELKTRILAGRHTEIRMLFFIGKDVFRWIDQCAEFADRDAGLRDAEVRRQSFAGLLTSGPPEPVQAKLNGWGVADHASIFSRAIGLNTIFVEPPPLASLAEEFLLNYHRYAEALFQCYLRSQAHGVIAPRNFQFELYASGEYSRMLETEWGTG